MKTKFIKGIMAAGFLASLLFSSCLKDDSHVFNPASTEAGNAFAEFPLGGLANFASSAITQAGIDTVAFAVNVATATDLTTPVTGTLAVDNSYIASYLANVSSTIPYQAAPAAAIKLQSNFTVPGGTTAHSVAVSIIVDRTQLDPSVSYMIPVKIASASVSLSSNYNVFYFHIIGNDFAGTYKWKFQRYNAADSTSAALNALSFDFSAGNTAIFTPISPTEFVVYTGYDGGNAIHYDVTFTKAVSGGVASYTNFAVQILPADATNVGLAANGGITFPSPAVFFLNGKPAGPTLPGPYTYAQALKIFHFQFTAATTAPRYIIDTYSK